MVNDLNLSIKFEIIRGALVLGFKIFLWSRLIKTFSILTKILSRAKIGQNRWASVSAFEGREERLHALLYFLLKPIHATINQKQF